MCYLRTSKAKQKVNYPLLKRAGRKKLVQNNSGGICVVSVKKKCVFCLFFTYKWRRDVLIFFVFLLSYGNNELQLRGVSGLTFRLAHVRKECGAVPFTEASRTTTDSQLGRKRGKIPVEFLCWSSFLLLLQCKANSQPKERKEEGLMMRSPEPVFCSIFSSPGGHQLSSSSLESGATRHGTVQCISCREEDHTQKVLLFFFFFA